MLALPSRALLALLLSGTPLMCYSPRVSTPALSAFSAHLLPLPYIVGAPAVAVSSAGLQAYETLGAKGERVLGFAYKKMEGTDFDFPFTNKPQPNFEVKVSPGAARGWVLLSVRCAGGQRNRSGFGRASKGGI